MKLLKMTVLGLLLLCMTAVGANADTYGNWEYTLTAEGATITGYTGSDTDITTPQVLGGKTVTIIGKAAFKHNDKVKRIVISDGVEKIEGEAFESSIIEEIILPDTLNSIGISAFWATRRLKSIVLPNSVGEIGEQALKLSGISSITLPSGLKSMPDHMLACCESLEFIEIPASVKQIGQLTFYGCTKLKEVVLPNGVETIGFEAFEKCENLEKIVIPESVTAINATAFNDCEKIVAYVYEDSYAHQWCIKNNIAFVLQNVINSMPKTGDHSQLALWCMVFAFAAFACRTMKRRTV